MRLQEEEDTQRETEGSIMRLQEEEDTERETDCFLCVLREFFINLLRPPASSRIREAAPPDLPSLHPSSGRMSSRNREAAPPVDGAVDLPSLHQSIGRHEVFISHRGIEMKLRFANYLYHSLQDHGIEAFLDMVELPKGHDVGPFMLEAARRAIIQVPIFTTIYAESRWCLDELVEMMKSTKSTHGAKMFPVFYDVKPEDLRIKNGGPFAKAIEAHRKDGKHNEDTIKGWEDALEKASWLEGFRLESFGNREGELVKNLVVKIEQEMQDRRRIVVEEDCKAVGLEKRVHHVVKLFHLEEKRNDVFFLLLWGMGGIGKTTLARAILNRLKNKFDAASFVNNCRDKKQIQIQDQLLNDLLHQKSSQGDEVDGRRECLERGLRLKKVLIILDDVEDFHSIEEVLKPTTSLQPGSQMLVTSRNQTTFPHDNHFSDVFRGERYEVQGLGDDESLRLFCFNAFKRPSPDPGFEKLAVIVSRACTGLPLSLEVLGRHLSGKKENKFWEEAIKMPYKDIESRLMISYNDLSEHEQEMFLDVACFLIGEARQSAEYFWDGFMVGWISGLERLVDLCLVKVGEDKCLTMHDQLRDLGRSIVKKSGKWSRVWDDRDLMRVLRSKKGLDEIRGLATSLPDLNWGLLSQMSSLRLLFLHGTPLAGDNEGLKGLEIGWLKWIPPVMPDVNPWNELLSLEFLTVLELKLWRRQQVETPISYWQPKKQDFGSLKFLEELDVGGSAIRKLPLSFWQQKRLRKLDMVECEGLEELSEDIGSLESLEELDVRGVAIRKLPSSFGQLKKLRKLDMGGCYRLEDLSEDFGSLESLEELDVRGLGIRKLPSSFGQLKKLRKLDMGWCEGLEELLEDFGSLESLAELVVRGSRIRKLPSSFWQLEKLRKLDMGECKELEELSKDFGSLESLEELDVEGAAIRKLPSSFGQLKKLRKLDMGRCEGLEELLEDFGSLESLAELVVRYARIRKLPSSFGRLKKLRKLDMGGCQGLEELSEDFGSLESLEELDIEGSGIRKLPSSFGQLGKLRKLHMGWCYRLRELPKDFLSLESLEELDVDSWCFDRLPSSWQRRVNSFGSYKLKKSFFY